MRILDDAHPTDVEDIKRLRVNRRPELTGPGQRVVGALDRDVGVPHGRGSSVALLLGLRGDRRDVAPTQLHHRVGHALTDVLVLGFPSEELDVEALRPVLIGRGQVGPREGAWRIRGPFAHR